MLIIRKSKMTVKTQRVGLADLAARRLRIMVWSGLMNDMWGTV